MNNAAIAAVFDQIADLLEFDGANPFRVRAYRKGSQVMGDLTESAATIVADEGRSLTDLEGIGDELATKIMTILDTGELPMLEELQAKIPPGAIAMMRINGVGPKKAAAIHKELGVSSLAELKEACEEGRVQQLKGFGKKTEEAILAGMEFAEKSGERIYWSKADWLAEKLLAHMQQCKAIEQIEMAGSYRRGRETVGDLDCLTVSSDVRSVMNQFEAFEQRADTIARGETKMAIRTHAGLQIDLRVVPAESFGAALQYFTGSKDHNVTMRGMAKKRNLKISEWGVFQIDDNGGESYVAGRTEEEVYATLDLPWFPPELRENRQEFTWAAEGELPELIEEKHIRGDLHMHTNETDGKATLAEMIEAAIARGLQYIAITDHSQRVSMANGLTPKRLLAQWKQIDEMRKEFGDQIGILKGIECDILEAGGMDLPDDVLAQGDWIIASVHYGQQQSREQITERILGALENPHVNVIAHPTGRLINKREAYEVDMDAVIAAAKSHGKLLELNANPMRLDLHDIHCAAAKRAGVPIVINTDAHSTDQLDKMRYGIMQARRAGLTKADCANTKTWKQFEKMLSKS
jgi:DNA polymerase (family 10)